MTVALIIPAAGSGQRLGIGVPKALADLAGKPLIRRTLQRLATAAEFAETVVLAPAADLANFTAALGVPPSTLGGVRVLAGGATRQESVAVGVAAVSPAIQTVCVHDAARPLIAPETVRAVLDAARSGFAVTAASRPTDSVREEREDGRSAALDRKRLWLVETPQAFSRAVLLEAHRRAAGTGSVYTDDASLVEATGQQIRIVETVGRNLKVTLAADLAFAADLLR